MSDLMHPELSEQEYWRQLIVEAKQPKTIEATTFLQKEDGTFNTGRWICEDGKLYVVKMPEPEAIRTSVNEQVAGRLGKAFGAPVPEVCLVHVSRELLAAQQTPQTQTNVFHASLWIPGCEPSREINDHGVPQNRSRFARLAILYAWLQAHDRQFLYQKLEPKLVCSHDHGHFFPNGPNWKRSDLENPQTLIRIDGPIKKGCNLTAAEIKEAKTDFGAVNVEVIASAVKAPPEEWNFSSEDRVAMAVYLARARNYILS